MSNNKTKDKTKLSEQEKTDRKKEFIMKGLILSTGFFALAMFCFAILIGVYSDNNSLAAIFFGIMIACIVLAIICTIIVFAIGNTIKTANSKDCKIKKYVCGIDKPLRESCQTIYGEVQNFAEYTQDFYCMRIKEEGLTRSEMYCFAYLEVDESFNESTYISKIEQIAEINQKDIYARTLIVCFTEKQPCKYVKEIMHSPAYYGLNEVLILCVYDEATKTLKVNKTKCAFGDRGYNDARRELKNIFSFVTPQKTEKALSENTQQIKDGNI